MSQLISLTKSNQLGLTTCDPSNNPNFLISPMFADINSIIYEKLVSDIVYKENPYFSSDNNLFSTLNPEKIIELPKNSTTLENLIVKNIYVENILANSINSSFFKNKIYSYTNVENTSQNNSKFMLCRYFSGIHYNLNLYKHGYNNLKAGYNLGNFQQDGVDINGNPKYLDALTDPNYVNGTPILNLLNYKNMLNYELNENVLQNSLQNRISYLWDYRKFSTQFFNNLIESNRDKTDMFDPEFSVNLYTQQKPLLTLSSLDLLSKNFWQYLQRLNLVGPVYDNQGILQNQINNAGQMTGYDVQQARIYPHDLERVVARYDNSTLIPMDDEFWQSQTIIHTGSRYSKGVSKPPRGICLTQQGDISALDNVRIVQSYGGKKFNYHMILHPITENTYTIKIKERVITVKKIPFTSNFQKRQFTLIRSIATNNIVRYNINGNQNNYLNCLKRLQYFNSLYNLGVDIKANWSNKNNIKVLLNNDNLYFIHEAVDSTVVSFDEFYGTSLLKKLLDHTFYYNLNFSYKINDTFELRLTSFAYEKAYKPRIMKTDDLDTPNILKPHVCMMITMDGHVADFNRSLSYDMISLCF